MLCKCLAGTVGGEGRVGGGGVIVVSWGFWKCLLGGLSIVVGTWNPCGGDGGVSAGPGRLEWVCVHEPLEA